MDRARDFHFVKQLPRTNCAEVEYSDEVYDRQVLLNETWATFGARNGFPVPVQHEEHVKWVTETWQEYLDRVPQRSAALQAYFQAFSDQKSQETLANEEKKRRCDGTVARLMEQERNYTSSMLATAHTLYVDFEAELLKKHSRQRAECELDEAAARAAQEDEEEKARAELRRMADEAKAAVQAILDEQRRLQEENEARIKEEQRQKAEELRRIEEDKQRMADEAERKRREDEEEAKRAERRRKEEDRRAKAKAEREARAGGRGRGSAATAQSKEEQRNASRAARWARMTIEMSTYLDELQPRCDAVDSAAGMQELYGQMANELGGQLLFGTAVYIATPQPQPQNEAAEEATAAPPLPQSNEKVNTLRYVHASTNCSQQLRSGDATLTKDDARADGVSPITFDCCLLKGRSTGIIRHAEKQLVDIGNWVPNMGTGDFMATPVINANSGLVTAVIACDTMTGNLMDGAETLTGMPAEEHCYLKNDANKEDTLHLAMPEAQGSFLEKVGECFSSAETRLASGTDASSAAAGEGQDTGDGSAGDSNTVAVQEEAEAVVEEEAKSHAGLAELKMDPNSVTSLPQLFQILTDHLHNNTQIEGTDAKLNVYISRLPKPDGTEGTVVAHNGILLNDPTRHTAEVPCHLLGESLKDAQSLSFTSFHRKEETTHVYVPNVTGDDRVVLYQAKATKQEECLLLVPLKDKKQRVIALVGCSCPAPPGLSPELIQAILAMIRGQSNLLHRLLLRSHLSQLCAQACEWIELTTGAPNVYISLKESALQGGGTGITAATAGGGDSDGSSSALHYVAASTSQQWMVGKVIPDHTTGVSHAILNAPGAATEGQSINIPSVAAFKHEATGSTVHCFGEGSAGHDGSLLSCPIAHGGEAFGLVYADTVGPAAQGSKKKTFTKSDEDLMKTTGQLLGGLMGEILYGRPATPGSDREDTLVKRVLSIEDLVGLEHIEFLKRIWVQVSSNIQNIKKDQLLEMSKYNSPPPVIPVVVGATFIVMGTKPKSVEKWEDSRKKIKYTILEKIINYDPTSTKVKKAFFQRARKMTKGHTADDVFTKGSYPASCFFTWTFVTILLRKSADVLRKKVKSGELDLSKPGASGDDATESMATDDTMGAEEGDDMMGEEGDDLPEAEEEEAVEETA